MTEGLYVAYTTSRNGLELTWKRTTFRAFRSLSPKRAAELLRRWADELDAFSKKQFSYKEDIDE